MGNVCTIISDSHEHNNPEFSDYEDTSASSTQSNRSSHGGLSFTKRLINFSGKGLISMKKTRYTRAARSWESAVWRRTIIMGERCEPPDFSGLILYDEHGNSIQDIRCKPH